MSEQRVTITEDRKPELVSLIRRLPGILAGRVPDEHGIAAGFRARLGNAFFSLVAPNFNELGRGNQGADGTRWPHLSPEYLAYQRPITGREPPKAGGLAPGGKDGLLTPEQLKLWRREYAAWLAWNIMSMPEREAKERAAGAAWNAVKRAGGKTKLADPSFGGRKPGVDYQMLVDTGRGRQSLQPGELLEHDGPDAEYRTQPDQVAESTSYQAVFGTNVVHMSHHHAAKSDKRRRRLWPEQFPADWWRQILGTARGGLVRIASLFGGRL